MPAPIFLISALVLGLWGCRRLPPDQAHFLKAQKAYDKQQYATALAHLTPLVESGHPAAQLLLAKMYTHGSGVKHDAGKAEMLRSLVALRMAARSLTPEQRSQAAPFAKMLLGLPDDPDARPGENEAHKALENLDPAALEKLADEVQQGLTLPSTTVPGPARVSRPTQSRTPSSDPVISAPLIPENARRANAISLGLLQRKANQGDPLAMELLAGAYEQGFYGLRVNPEQAVLWAQRAAQARRNEPTQKESAAPDGRVRLMILSGVGLLLIGSGLWLAKRVR